MSTRRGTTRRWLKVKQRGWIVEEDRWRRRREFFTGDFPTSTLVEVRALATPQPVVEVNATGFLGGSR